MDKKRKSLVVLLLIILLMGCSPRKTVYQLAAQGEIFKVEYIQGSFWEDTKTIIYFTNGSVFVMRYGAYSLPKKVKIYQGNDDRRISDPLYKVEELK